MRPKIKFKKGHGRGQNGWTAERRARQAEKIRSWKPWERATGPRTNAGKERSRMNAVKNNMRGADMNAVRRTLRQQRRFLAIINKGLRQKLSGPAFMKYYNMALAQYGYENLAFPAKNTVHSCA